MGPHASCRVQRGARARHDRRSHCRIRLALRRRVPQAGGADYAAVRQHHHGRRWAPAAPAARRPGRSAGRGTPLRKGVSGEAFLARRGPGRDRLGRERPGTRDRAGEGCAHGGLRTPRTRLLRGHLRRSRRGRADDGPHAEARHPRLPRPSARCGGVVGRAAFQSCAGGLLRQHRDHGRQLDSGDGRVVSARQGLRYPALAALRDRPGGRGARVRARIP